MKKLFLITTLLFAQASVFAAEESKTLSCKYKMDEYAKNGEEWLPLENTSAEVNHGFGQIKSKVFSLTNDLSLELSGPFFIGKGSAWNKQRSKLFLTTQLIKKSKEGKPVVIGYNLTTSDDFMNKERFSQLRDGATDVVTYSHLKNSDYLTDVMQENKIAKDAIVDVDVLCELK